MSRLLRRRPPLIRGGGRPRRRRRLPYWLALLPVLAIWQVLAATSDLQGHPGPGQALWPAVSERAQVPARNGFVTLTGWQEEATATWAELQGAGAQAWEQVRGAGIQTWEAGSLLWERVWAGLVGWLTWLWQQVLAATA